MTRSTVGDEFMAKMWAGFVDGRLYLSSDEHGYVAAALFNTEKKAREKFEDVRLVELRELKQK